MKRYFLFQYDQYYPSGGMRDLAGTFETLEELIAFKGEMDKEWKYNFNKVYDSHNDFKEIEIWKGKDRV